MTKVVRQLQHPAILLAPPTVERRSDEALAILEDPTGSPARTLQARVLAYAQASEPHVDKYPGWVRVAILLCGMVLSWGLIGLAALPLLH